MELFISLSVAISILWILYLGFTCSVRAAKLFVVWSSLSLIFGITMYTAEPYLGSRLADSIACILSLSLIPLMVVTGGREKVERTFIVRAPERAKLKVEERE